MTVIKGACKSCALMGLMLLTTSGCGREQVLAKGMNLLLVTLDTTRADFVSPFGGDPRNTPHLQALADRSTIFTYAVSETNITNPSHLTIMSGLRMVEHGMTTNKSRVPDSVDTLAEAMNRAGYRTAGIPATRHAAANMGWRGFDSLQDVKGVLTADVVSDRALKWLEEQAVAPFFMWVHYFDPHGLYQPPPEIAASFYRGNPEAGDGPEIAAHSYFERKPGGDRVARWLGRIRDPEYPRAMYAAEIHFTDRELGRLLSGLERLGLADETLVVVIADHGESLGEHDIFYSHQGIYEQQLRIPLIVHVPGLAASRSDALVTTLDVVPSISELTGIRLQHEPSGLSFVPSLLGEESPTLDARAGFIHHQDRNRSVALRQDGWKLIWPLFKKDPVLSKQPQLYHLSEDPEELVDLAAAHPERARTMRRTLQRAIEPRVVQRDDDVELSERDLKHLRALGYLDD